MTMIEVQSDEATDLGRVSPGDMTLEVVVIPVSNVDRAKRFYANLGWRLDADAASGRVRVVQFTPPGSACSIMFGQNITAAAPGSVQTLHLVLADIAAARDALVTRGVVVSQVFHCPMGFCCPFRHDEHGTSDWSGGPVPDRLRHGSFVSFSDPDGNRWVLQEGTTPPRPS